MESWRELTTLFLGPMAVWIATQRLESLPERSVEIYLRIDLRAAALLGCVMLVAVSLLSIFQRRRGSSCDTSFEAVQEPVPVAAKLAEPAATSGSAAAGEGEPGEGGSMPLSPSAAKPQAPDDSGAIPHDLARALAGFKKGDAAYSECKECSACKEVMLLPRRMGCQHYACDQCLQGLHKCPTCKATVDVSWAQPAPRDMIDNVAALRCTCLGCGKWEGPFGKLHLHIRGCLPAQGVVAMRSYRQTGDSLRLASARSAVDKLHADMRSTSPAIVHRFPPEVFESGDCHWCTPIFSACRRLWCIRVGVPFGSTGARYFCILSHGHRDRLRCSFVFARKAGEGYKERAVHDWPKDLEGHPWGPTIAADELEQYKQSDGSLLMMVHALELGKDGATTAPYGS